MPPYRALTGELMFCNKIKAQTGIGNSAAAGVESPRNHPLNGLFCRFIAGNQLLDPRLFLGGELE
jgi:hypothetical protein